MWRRNNQEIYFDFQEDKKINLILAVNWSKIIYYKITSGQLMKMKMFLNYLWKNYMNHYLNKKKKNIVFSLIIYHFIQLLNFLLYIKKT